MKPAICIYHGHDMNVTVYDFDRNEFICIEYERMSGVKHHSVGRWTDKVKKKMCRKYWIQTMRILKKQYNINPDFSTVLVKGFHSQELLYEYFLDYTKDTCTYDHLLGFDHLQTGHHLGHCYSAFITSPFTDCVGITYDVSGDNDSTVIWDIVDGQLNSTEKRIHQSAGYAYNTAAMMCSQLKLTKEAIDLAGKLMGLAGYGHWKENFTEKWIKAFREICGLHFRKPAPGYPLDGNIIDDEGYLAFPWRERIKMFRSWEHLAQYDKRIVKDPKGISLSAAEETSPAWYGENKEKAMYRKFFLKDQEEADMAYAAQLFIERFLREKIEQNMELIQSRGNNLILSGGCALNVLANERMKKEFPWLNIYVAINPGDGGISLGLLSNFLIEKQRLDYSTITARSIRGMKMFDSLDEFFPDLVETNHHEVAEIIRQGKIIGLIQGECEFGPRALGNRSILCDPSFPDMKNILNDKVKHRENYRPFAPICLRSDAPKYFESNNFRHMEHMSFVVDVKEEFREKYKPITHADNTARLQTVTRFTNQLLYDILTVHGGVLLNTSFNVQGKPILNTYEEAAKILKETELDYVVILDEERGLLRTQ